MGEFGPQKYPESRGVLLTRAVQKDIPFSRDRVQECLTLRIIYGTDDNDKSCHVKSIAVFTRARESTPLDILPAN